MHSSENLLIYLLGNFSEQIAAMELESYKAWNQLKYKLGKQNTPMKYM